MRFSSSLKSVFALIVILAKLPGIMFVASPLRLKSAFALIVILALVYFGWQIGSWLGIIVALTLIGIYAFLISRAIRRSKARINSSVESAIEAAERQSHSPEVEKLLAELVDIGRTDGFISKEPDGKFEHFRHVRVREIGKELDAIGGTPLMRTVCNKYDAIVTEAEKHGTHVINADSAALEIAWDGIGIWISLHTMD